MHGQVWAVERRGTFYDFPIPRRIAYLPEGEDPEPIDYAFGFVRYKFETFAIDWGPYGEQWSVLIYGENYQTQMRQLKGVADWLLWLAALQR